MKRLFLFSTLLGTFVLVALKTNGQPYFQGSTTPEITYPANDEPFRSNNTSAYSYGNLNIGGTVSDLFVFTWDGGDIVTVPVIGSGIAVRQGTPFTQVINPAGYPVDDVASTEAVILRQGSNIYILAAYYQVSQQRFCVDLYQYLGGGTLIQQAGYPQNITAFGATAPFGWIRLDAHSLNEFVVTWEEQGQILTKAGTAASGFSMGNTAILSSSIGPLSHPDVALIRSQQAGNQVRAHFVYTNQAANMLVASWLSFNSILTVSPLGTLSPTINDMHAAAGTYERPRIDAPDNFAPDDWSYVVEDYTGTPGNDYIFTGVMHNSSLQHFTLNNATLPTPAALIDISPTNFVPNNQNNNQPVVAYDNTGNNIYYCWYLLSNVNMPAPPLSAAYIGLKMSNTGNLFGPLDQYWMAQYVPGAVSQSPAIALSGQNDASPGLFMAFTQHANGPVYYTMGSKVVPWANTYFRPEGPSGISETVPDHFIQIVPNPFNQGFRIITNKDNCSYFITMTDLLGRQVLSLQGTASELNGQLENAGIHLPAGNYWLSLSDEQQKQTHVFKLVKIK